jgi:hypothetical protein
MPATPSTDYSKNNSTSPPRPQPHPQSCRSRPMASQTKSAHIRKVALPPALGDRNNMVRIPKRFPAPFPQSPLPEKPPPSRVIELANVAPYPGSIHPTFCADALVALENLFPQIAGIGTQLPLMDAGIRTKRAPPARNLRTTPTAQWAPQSASLNLRRFDPPALLTPGNHRGLTPPIRNSDCVA